jgi:hypothetical protein
VSKFIQTKSQKVVALFCKANKAGSVWNFKGENGNQATEDLWNNELWREALTVLSFGGLSC